jgi:PKD repeat protein
MNKYPLIGVSILAVVLLVLGSLSNVVGYQFVTLRLNKSSLSDVTITDGTGDVWSIDYLTGQATIVNYSPYINIVNLDLVKATYTQQGTQANLSLQVLGTIENRGMLINFYNGSVPEIIDTVEYTFDLSTSEQDYSVSYCNGTGRLYFDSEQINLTSSDFLIVGDTLSITFPLINGDEMYDSLSVTSTYIKANLSNLTAGFVYLTDVAPNHPLTISEVYAPDFGYEEEDIQFNGSAEPLTGTPPYTYLWDFGDGFVSTQQNPIHAYANAGVYTYTFTVTDSAEETVSEPALITIYELKKAFLFGRFMNMRMEGDFFTVEAINLRMILFKPFQFLHYINWEKITFSTEYKGVIISNHFLFGMFNVAVGSEPPQTPNMACTTDSTLNRIIVATADAGIKWRDIAITLDKPGATYQIFYTNGTAIAPVNNTAEAGVAEVIAGDYIQLSTYSGNVKTTLRYIPTNSLIGTWTVNV